MKSLSVSNDSKNIKHVSTEITEFIKQSNPKVTNELLFDIKLCIEEAVRNAMVHGNKSHPDLLVDISYKIDGYVPATDLAVVVAASTEVTRDKVLTEEGSISGTVTIAGPLPLADCLVTADDGSGNTFSDITAADGTYSIEVPPASYSVTFSIVDYVTATDAGVAVAESAAVVDDQLLVHV